MFGPDARSLSLSLNVSAGGHAGLEYGQLEILRGNHKGKSFIGDTAGLGIGSPELALGIEATDLYFSGNRNSITKATFLGERYEGNLSIDAGVSVGVNFSYARVGKHFVIGAGSSLGIGVSPTLIAGNINWGGSYDK